MGLKKVLFNIKGMTRDLAASKFSPEFAYENKNMRLVATDHNTSSILTNERGNLKVSSGVFSSGISGTPIGQAILNDNLILFTTGGAPSPVYLKRIHSTLSSYQSFKRYSTYTNAMNNTNGTGFIQSYSVGDDNYFYGDAGEYVGYTDTDGKRKVLSPTYGGVPVLVVNVDSDDNDLYYVTEYIEDAEAPDFGGNSIYFQLNTNADPNTTDKIYKISFNSGGTLVGEVLYSGTLGFNPSNPIEAITVFENEKIQKVYWTDGINQPRVINIAEDSPSWNDNSFNFVRNISYNGDITITKNQISFGSFAPGVIQYCFTYFDLYGTETNIFYTSPLYYVSPSTRGGNPEETVSCSFTISIPTYDSTFDYLRIYSILRTSINATPQVRKVVDISLKSALGTIKYTDTGVDGESLDPTALLFIGGEPIFAGTMAQKDNTLFLGDITINRRPLSTTVKDQARNLNPTYVTKTITLPDDADVGNYSYTSQLDKNNSQITYFRRGETYRLGFQAQHYTGKWSDVVFIRDYEVTNPITTSTGSVTVNNIRVQLNSTIATDLTNNGYVKVRPVVVFPDANDRTIICEGVCCPTVYNVEDRNSNSPYVQASWFFRPSCPGSIEVQGNALSRYVEFRHNYPIPANNELNAEIQCISNAPSLPVLGISNQGYSEKSSSDNWASENKECYYIDQSIFTFHSPDIEFDETLKNFEADNNVNDTIGFRIVGCVPINASYSDIDIEASAPANYANGKSNDVYQFKASVAPGFIKKTVTLKTSQSGMGFRSLVSGPLWFDDFSDSINENYLGDFPVPFVVYPWHKSGALNGASRDATNSILKHKAMSIFRFSRNNKMLTSSAISGWSKDISGAVRFDSDELSMVKIPAQGSSSVTYYGNIDKIVTIHGKPKGKFALRDYDGSAFSDSSSITTESDITKLPGAYPIVVASTQAELTLLSDPNQYNSQTDPLSREPLNVRPFMLSYDQAMWGSYKYLDKLYIDTDDSNTLKYGRYIYNDTKTVSTDPVSIKYKSTPHIVIALKNGTSSQNILPKCTNQASITTSYSSRLYWTSSSSPITGASQGTISVSPDDGYLWLGELYRKDISSATRFGGTSAEAIENNKWVVAGEPVTISSSAYLVWSQGDTYYQRYDCLKTYPFTNEDTNSVSDTLSFMCETRVNIDGRYDRNRGQLSTLYVTRANQNLVNMAYSQQNNYFVYRGLNLNKVNTTIFPNTITWSKTKSMGEEVDTWTNVTLASTLDVDGDKGKVQALRRYNNDILCFQDRGISQILYNENVQIASTTGVPIEIANSGKVSGKRYITNHIGCTNKWSICSTPNGMYFVDSLSSDIYLFNNQFNSLSDTLGFHSWTVNNLSSTSPWNPYDFNGCVTYYDKVTGDVMFITASTCLTFSEPIGYFSSFYDYGSTPFFATLKNRGIAFHQDSSNNKYYPYLHREGDYNYFFGTYKPFWTTVVVNPDPTEDKVFNNLEYRGDTFQYNSLTGMWDYKYNNTFDRLEVWDEYQRGSAILTDVKDWGNKYSNLKKKFRVWRANIPRNTTNQGGDTLHRYTRDRMRNPWLYLKLTKSVSNNYRTELHDLVVNYFE